jgi:CubicO group peptidase (beta-lactamase class C family)
MTSRFDSVWRSVEDTVASGWAPGIVAGARHGGETAFFATGVKTLGEPDLVELETPFRIASLSKLLAGVIAATMLRDGLFTLDEPVSKWLPELASPRVLVSPDAPLEQTVAATTQITVNHLLTMTHGLGLIFEDTPLSRAMTDSGVAAGPIPPQLSADEFIARVGELPLAHQPGERWMYNMACDILSVLIPRVAGKPLRAVLAERVTGPLQMSSTAFFGDASSLPTAYVGSESGLTVFDRPEGKFSSQPPFETLAGGLVSTVPDYMKFLTALADDQLVSADLRAAMTSDQLTQAQREGMAQMGDPTASWGWEVGVITEGTTPGASAGSYGWTGGLGTCAFVDPSNDLIGVVFTQRLMSGPGDTFTYFTDPLARIV